MDAEYWADIFKNYPEKKSSFSFMNNSCWLEHNEMQNFRTEVL